MDFATFIGAPLHTARRARVPMSTAVDRRPAHASACDTDMHESRRRSSGSRSAVEERASRSSTSATGGRVRTLSEESRAKISIALKGRRITPSHRSKISASLMGEKNPRYGRRLSAETRARIGAAVSAAGARRRAAAEAAAAEAASTPLPTADLPPRLRALRAKALASPLLTGAPSQRGAGVEDAAVERLLDRVRSGAAPPESVARVRAAQLARDQDAEEVRVLKCRKCDGAGTTRCNACVGTFGTVSQRCGACLGAGAVFCGGCQGAGVCT